MVIDFHTHIFPPRIRDDRAGYAGKDPCFAALYSDEKTKMATAEELIESMDKHGVNVSVVLNIGWSTNELCAETNDYMMEAVARYPDRLVGFCTVQPRDVSGAVAEIERCVKGGLRGIGELRPDTQQIDFSDEGVIAPFAEAVRENNLILLFHASEPVGHVYAGKGEVTPEILYPFIAAFPDITTVCAHWGGGLPFYALMPEVSKAMENVYFDTAASPYLYKPAIYREAGDLAGFDKILFGSDYPLILPSRLMKEISEQKLPAETESMILSGNARRLLGI
jgi:hypothetical protein